MSCMSSTASAMCVCDDGAAQLSAAAALAGSMDWPRTIHKLEQPLERYTYNRVLAKFLQKYSSAHLERAPEYGLTVEQVASRRARCRVICCGDWNAQIMSWTTVREFDANAVAPIHGFQDVFHYYRDGA